MTKLLDVTEGHKRLIQVIIFLNFVPVHVMACPVNLLRRFLKLPNKLRQMDFDLKMFYFWELFEKKQKWKFLISKRFVSLNLIGRNLIGQERHLVCTKLKLKNLKTYFKGICQHFDQMKEKYMSTKIRFYLKSHRKSKYQSEH